MSDAIKVACDKVKEARAMRLEDLLNECAEFLEPYEDVEDRSDGTVRANKAMSLRARILAELAE